MRPVFLLHCTHYGCCHTPQVAEVCVEALVCDAAKDKVVEVIAEKSAPPVPLSELFARV